jgi:hypothetical protein
MILKFFLSICRKFCLTVLIQVFLLSTYPQQKFFAQRSISNNLGIFSGSADVGNIGIPGSATFNSDDSSYVISGSGENMWFGKDAFHFVNIMAYGNIALEADITWIGDGTNPHRKAGVIIRQNLNHGSIYADAIVHGDGLTSLQYREAEDSMTYEIRAGIEFPSRLRIKKVGKYISMEYGFEGESYQPSGASVRLVLEDPFYIGLGVCSHEDSVLEKAVFRNVKYEHLESENNMKIRSILETINIESKNRQVIYTADRHFEAPNWSGDNSFFIFNSEGLLYRLPSEGGIPQVINTDFAVNCNNDHGLSPDNSQIVISDQTMEDKQSRIYILPAEGGTPKLITPNAPSYWHGWSPDGRMLAYCAERNGQYDIYAIPVNGGDERQLTFSEGLDDGPH